MLQHHWCNTRRDSASYCNWKKSTRTQSALAFAISQCSVNLINITCANSVNVTQSISISKSKGKADDFRMFPGFCQKERIFFAHQTKEPVFAKSTVCNFARTAVWKNIYFQITGNTENCKIEFHDKNLSICPPLGFCLFCNQKISYWTSWSPCQCYCSLCWSFPAWNLKYSVTPALIMILVIFNHYYENLCNIIVTLNVRLDLLPPSTKPTRTKSPAMTSAVFALN